MSPRSWSHYGNSWGAWSWVRQAASKGVLMAARLVRERWHLLESASRGWRRVFSQLSLQRWSPGSAQGPGDTVEAWVTEGALVRGGGLSVLKRAKGLLVKEGRAGLQVTQ